jgi:hypothetical protein
MAERALMERLCGLYVRRAKAIGVLYCAVPTLVWFLAVVVSVPFRGVYVLRLALSLVIGGWIGAELNAFGLALWLTKHRSPAGPATAVDGALIGAAVGVGTALLPPLTSLISSHHLEEAKWFIIGSYLGAALAGAAIGSTLAVAGRRYIARQADPGEGQRR